MVFEADRQAFRIVRLKAVFDALGLDGEQRGGSVVPFDASPIAVIAKALNEVGPG
ncbi:hypothetical protein D9M71_836010 [compost metagenome]